MQRAKDLERRLLVDTLQRRGNRFVAGIERLLTAARTAGAPVIYPHVAPKSAIDAGRTGTKIPSLLEVPDKGYQFVATVTSATSAT